jgi:hypothetical protein
VERKVITVTVKDQECRLRQLQKPKERTFQETVGDQQSRTCQKSPEEGTPDTGALQEQVSVRKLACTGLNQEHTMNWA